MGKKSQPKPQVTTTTVQPTYFPGQQELLSQIFPKVADQFLNNQDKVQYFPGNTVAPFSANTQTAQQGVVNYANTVGQNFINQVMGANAFGLGDVLKPESNPALAASIQAAINPVQQRLQDVILPGIAADAVGSDAFSGSRRGIAEGIALKDFNQQALDATAKMANTNYQAGLDTFSKSLALSPYTFNLGTQPSVLQGQVGAQQEARDQAKLDEEFSRYMFNLMAPLNLTRDAASIGFGAPTAGSTSTGTAPGLQQPGAGSRILGGAATGASIGSAIPGIGTGIGAVGGALLGLFGGK